MAQKSHVPKFGNWETDNVPYTAYFENARKEKTSGVMFNPNDPEENPEAFMFGRTEFGNNGVSAHESAANANSNKSISVEKHEIEEQKQFYGCRRRNGSDHDMSGSQKSVNSESSSDKSKSGLRREWRQAASDRSKSSDSKNGLYLPSPGPNVIRRGRNPSDESSNRSASVPKFGAWDEKDPTSGEGFTVIFNKVKEEKHIAAANFPVFPPPSNSSDNQKKKTKSKICCCLF